MYVEQFFMGSRQRVLTCFYGVVVGGNRPSLSSQWFMLRRAKKTSKRDISKSQDLSIVGYLPSHQCSLSTQLVCIGEFCFVMTSYHPRISCRVCGSVSPCVSMLVKTALVSATGMLEYMFVMCKEAWVWCGISGVSLKSRIRPTASTVPGPLHRTLAQKTTLHTF